MEIEKRNKTSSAQLKAIKKYQSKHKDNNYRNQKKSRAKNFLLNDARIDELEFFNNLISERLKELKNNKDNNDIG